MAKGNYHMSRCLSNRHILSVIINVPPIEAIRAEYILLTNTAFAGDGLLIFVGNIIYVR